jgi:hypothetical protein
MDDIQYIENVSRNASAVLSQLFELTPPSIIGIDSLNILVIGSGFFPSLSSFVKAISTVSTNLKNIHFTLIEPLKSETDRFEAIFTTHNLSRRYGFTITYSIQNMDIKVYLMNVHDQCFDIVYFEQPDLSPVGILLAKSGVAAAKLDLSLRESIPYLKKVVSPQSILIASFLYKKDMKQLNALIRYSKNLQTKIIVSTENKRDGAPYNSGLIAIVDPAYIHKSDPEILAESIKRQDTSYWLLLVLSFLIFLVTPPIAKALSAFCTLSLLMYHRYGVGSHIIKIAIIAVQLAVLLGTHYLIKL